MRHEAVSPACEQRRRTTAPRRMTEAHHRIIQMDRSMDHMNTTTVYARVRQLSGGHCSLRRSGAVGDARETLALRGDAFILLGHSGLAAVSENK